MDSLAGRKGKTKVGPIELVKSISRSSSPELLSSDDEGASAIAPTTLNNLPQYFPGLPPKHTYLQTPVCFLHPNFCSYITLHSLNLGFTSEEGCPAIVGKEAQNSCSCSRVVTKFIDGHGRRYEPRRCRAPRSHC